MRAATHVLPLLVIACATVDDEPRPVTTPPAPVANTTALSVGPPPEFATPEHPQASLERADVAVVAHADVQLKVRVEFAGLAEDQGLNYLGVGSADDCDELVPEVQEIAVLDDGRWLVDAQMACRSGEDYFSATNEHALVLVDASQRRAEILWTGVDVGSDAMGVCVSWTLTSFLVDGDTLRISQSEVTKLDREAAERLPAAADGCEPKPEQTRELARIDLARPP